VSSISRASLALLVFAAACGHDAEGRGAPPDVAIPVQVAAVVPAGQAGTINASGTLGAKDEVTLSFKIGGIVGKVYVDDGAKVHKGQVLAALDLREIDAMVAKATAGAEKARRDAARAERLFRDSVATIAQMQDAQTARDAAEADLRVARVNHDYATIVAPSDGVVLSRIANAGQMVGSGAPVIQFASNARGRVLRTGVPDREAVQIKVGDLAEVAFEAVPGKVFKGRVSQVGAAADPRTGLYTIEIALEGVQSLPSGLVGRAVIAPMGRGRGRVWEGKGSRVWEGKGAVPSPSSADDAVYSIPAEALVEGDKDRGTVFTVDASGKRAKRVSVQLVGLEGSRVLVRGLDGVSRVVRSGAVWLTDSARVEIKP
jgi:RND family efflux transporter MFP subunit